MKTVTIEISNCAECPHYIAHKLSFPFHDGCKYLGAFMSWNDPMFAPRAIPADCPLDDAVL